MPALTFGEILDAAHELPLDDQTELLVVLRQRVAEAQRAALLEQVLRSERELDAGLGREITPDKFAAEMLR